MANANPKVEQVKELIRNGIHDRTTIAQTLGVPPTSAATYLSVAKKELAAEEAKQTKAQTQTKKEAVATEETLEKQTLEKQTLEKQTIMPEAVTPKRRLKPKIVASDFFVYTLEQDKIGICSSANQEACGSLDIDKKELTEFIEDLKELKDYL